MRLKLGRPDIGRYADRFDVPAADTTGLSVTFLGVLIHWDDFFRPLPTDPRMPPLRALPYAGDDLDATMSVLSRLAESDGVTLSFPTVWRREDPWT